MPVKKKVLIVGAARMQIALAEKARELGYKVILCANSSGDPAIKYSDETYIVPSDDKESILAIAQKLHIDGVISNASMYMTTVAYVANRMGLVGNPESAIKVLEAKLPFRELQEQLGLYAPKSRRITNFFDFIRETRKMTLPVMLKPDLGSATNGQRKIVSKWQIPLMYGAFLKAKKNSFNGRVCIEEFVENREVLGVQGEVCIYNGQYLWDGFYSVVRSKHNGLLDTIDILPGALTEEDLAAVKDSVYKIFGALGVVHGQYNLEGFFTKAGDFFVLEINPRQAGDEMSKLIEYTTGIDYNRLLVETSVGEFGYLNSLSSFRRKQRYVVRYRAFSSKKGIFNGFSISPEMVGKILAHEERPIGSKAKPPTNLARALGSYTIEFASKEELYKTALRLEDLIVPNVV